MNFWRNGVGLECMFFIPRSLELRALHYVVNRPPRAAASFNHALQRTRRERRGCNRCVPCAGSLNLGLGRNNSLNHERTIINMKTTILLCFVVTSALFMSRTDVGAQGAIINWQGNGGYRAQITMTYDASFALVSAQGGGPFGGVPTNQGINSLSVEFFLPSSLTPVYSTQNISNSIVTYKFLGISFDTVSRSLIGSLDIGRDSFAEGDPGSS